MCKEGTCMDKEANYVVPILAPFLVTAPSVLRHMITLTPPSDLSNNAIHLDSTEAKKERPNEDVYLSCKKIATWLHF